MLKQNNRQLIYPVVVAAILIVWVGAMVVVGGWRLYGVHWEIALTMAFGSFIGSATPLGGGAVAFPIFTKALMISSDDSRTFALMIQAIGMGAASALIVAQRIRILPRAILFVSGGGALGIVLGTQYTMLPAPMPKLLFTTVAAVFAVALVIAQWFSPCSPQSALPEWTIRQQVVFVAIGVLGGWLSGTLGAGVNLITFVVLTLAYGIDAKISTPTSVIIMAINAWLGFFLHALWVQDVGVVWEYWLVAVPIVIFGAPLGAFAASKVSREVIIISLVLLVLAELLSTVLLVPLTLRMTLLCTLVGVGCGIAFARMLQFRQTYIA